MYSTKSPPAEERCTSAPASTVLLVDDDPATIAVFEEILSGYYRLHVASTGEEALALAERVRPDLVILDIVLPDLDGYEVCRRIRGTGHLCHTKIIMASANAEVIDRLVGYEAGADDYLSKPFEVDELLAKVRVFLRLKSVEELDRMKHDTLSLFSHETNTPLNGILAPAEMLQCDGPIDDEERRELARIIYSSANRLRRFVERILMLNSLRSGRTKLERHELDLCSVVRAAIEAVAGENGDRIRWEKGEEDAVPIVGDERFLRILVGDLVDNALRYSPEAEPVAIRVDTEDKEATLAIIDRGPGIDPKQRPFLFEPFSDPDSSHHSAGQGLGLSIAHSIARAHRGNIELCCGEPAGANFTIRLPLAVD